MSKPKAITLNLSQARQKARDGLQSAKFTPAQNQLATAKLPNLISKAQSSGWAGMPLTKTATASIYVVKGKR